MTATLADARAEWAGWLRSAGAAGRLLTGLSNAIAPAKADPLSEQAAGDLIAALRRSGADSPEHLIDALDLLCGDHTEFIANEVMPALRVLRPEWVRERSVATHMGSGTVRWPDTFVGRASRRLRSNEFMMARPRRADGSPELRAIGAYLADLSRAGEALVDLVGTRRAHASLLGLTRTAAELLRREPLGGQPPVLHPGDWETVRASRTAAPRRCIERLQRRAEMRAAGRRGLLTASLIALSANWLEPVVDDALFELLVLAKVLHLIEHDLGYGAPASIGLLFKGADKVARFHKGPWTLDVHFDRAAPPIFGGKSRYSGLREDYAGLSLADRRPDITVSWTDGTERRAMLLELKCTFDPVYIRQSIYKAFGYAHDLANVVPFSSATGGIAVVFPQGAGVTRRAAVSDRVSLYQETDASLREALLIGGVPA